jgi:hypothetical protein
MHRLLEAVRELHQEAMGLTLEPETLTDTRHSRESGNPSFCNGESPALRVNISAGWY